jgi:hypothetical protein
LKEKQLQFQQQKQTTTTTTAEQTIPTLTVSPSESIYTILIRLPPKTSGITIDNGNITKGTSIQVTLCEETKETNRGKANQHKTNISAQALKKTKTFTYLNVHRHCLMNTVPRLWILNDVVDTCNDILNEQKEKGPK